MDLKVKQFHLLDMDGEDEGISTTSFFQQYSFQQEINIVDDK